MSKPGSSCRTTANPLCGAGGPEGNGVAYWEPHLQRRTNSTIADWTRYHDGRAVAFFNTVGPTTKSPANRDGGLRIYTKPPECDKSFSLGK